MVVGAFVDAGGRVDDLLAPPRPQRRPRTRLPLHDRSRIRFHHHRLRLQSGTLRLLARYGGVVVVVVVVAYVAILL